MVNANLGFFLGGVKAQETKNRELGLRESQLNLSRRQMLTEQITSQSNELNEQAAKIVSSGKMTPQLANAFLEAATVAKQNAMAAGLGIDPVARLERTLQGTPTPAEQGAAEATTEVAGAATKIDLAGENEELKGALGLDRKIDTITMVNPNNPNDRRTIDATDVESFNRLKNQGYFEVSISFQPTTTGDLLTGQTPESIEDARAALGGLQDNLGILEDTLSRFEKTPEAGGVMGSLIETGLGLVEQIPVVGEDIANTITDKETRERVRDARTRARIAVSRMLSTITGEESGRFTEQERRLAENTLAALDPTAGPTQIQQALRTTIEIMKDAQSRQINTLLNASGADLATAQGRRVFFDVLIKNDFSEDDAVDAIARMLKQRGITDLGE